MVGNFNPELSPINRSSRQILWREIIKKSEVVNGMEHKKETVPLSFKTASSRGFIILFFIFGVYLKNWACFMPLALNKYFLPPDNLSQKNVPSLFYGSCIITG